MYDVLLGRVLHPLFETVVKRRKVYRYLQDLRESQFWTLDALRQRQLDELRRLLVHAGQQCPYYAQLFRDHDFYPERLTRLEDFFTLPCLTKDIINERREELVASGWRTLLWPKATGGSTGSPLRFYCTSDSYDWRTACTMRGYGWAGCRPGVRQLYLWGVQLGRVSRLQRWKESLHHALMGQSYFNCFDFSEERMAELLLELNRDKPPILVGYTGPLYRFAVFLAGQDRRLDYRPQAVITAAEALLPFQRRQMEEAFGASVFHTYGSREFMLIGAECEYHAGLHLSMENLLVEVVDAAGRPVAPGESGEIVVTDLHNYGMPFVRYRIGDLGRMSPAPCPCGRGLPLLAEVIGRSLDMLRTRDGRHVAGEFFPHLFKDFCEVGEFQVVQDAIDRLDIFFVLAGGFQADHRERLEEEVRRVMGPAIEVRYHVCDAIPQTGTGKHRVTICRIPPSE